MKDKKPKNKDAVKNSIVLSGLIGTAGLFVAKILGLIYSIPLSSLLSSDAYMSFYGTSYRIYSYILNVFTAGIPFAISTMVAKYTVKDDARSLRKIKNMSLTILGLLGIAGMLVLMVIAGPLSILVAGKEDAHIMSTCLRILACAIFFVPVLSAYRGFWQGRKEMREYAFSQAFEQFFRVGFLLSAAFLAVYSFHMERKWALYLSVMSTSIAAIAGILQIRHFDKVNYATIEEAAKVQTTKTCRKKKLFREFITLAIPYLLVAVIGYCDDVFNSVLLPAGLKLHGYTQAEQSVILSAFNYVGSKLNAIPMILAPGFIAALIPHITAAREEKNMTKVEKNVSDCIGIVLYIGMPVCLCIGLYAKDFYNILFYTSNSVLASECVRWLAIEGFLGTLNPVITNIMMALGLKKDVLKKLLINAMINGVTMVPFIWLWGFKGGVISVVLAHTYLAIGNMIDIQRSYHMNLKPLYISILRMAVASVVMILGYNLLCMVGITGSVGSKLPALVKMCVNGMVCMILYIGATSVMKVPENIFHTSLKDAIGRRIHRG